MLGPIISENDPPFFAPWITLAYQSSKKSEALNCAAMQENLYSGYPKKGDLNQPAQLESRDYSKTCVKWPLNNRQNKGINDNW